VAQARSTVVEAHVQVDTGLGFGGFLVDEPDKVLLAYRSLPHVALSGIYTQIQGTTHPDRAAEQLARFDGLLRQLHAAGYETGTVHVAGSYALLHYDGVARDAVRAGSALLGRCRRERGDGLQTVGHGEVSIAETHWLPKGHTVGTWKLTPLRRPTRVAVLPVGWQNGLGLERPRGEERMWQRLCRAIRRRRFTVRIGDRRAPVIGDIGAGETLVDITDLKCSAGDIAIFDLDPAFARGLAVEYR
jgi:alanine racemase